MLLDQVEKVLMLIISAIGTGFFLKWFIGYQQIKEELKKTKIELIGKDIENEKQKIHAKYDNQPIDDLLNSSPKIYGKLGPRKDN